MKIDAREDGCHVICAFEYYCVNTSLEKKLSLNDLVDNLSFALVRSKYICFDTIATTVDMQSNSVLRRPTAPMILDDHDSIVASFRLASSQLATRHTAV